MKLLTCRICLSEEEENVYYNSNFKNPLITPCECIGSVKYVHLECLQTWLQSKVNVKENGEHTTQILWKNLDCELCKTQYSNFVWQNEHNLSIVEIKKPENNYVILEMLSRENNNCKGIFLARFEGN